MLDLAGRTGPLHVRLAAALRGAVRQGLLRPGTVLPSSRTLAADLGCSRWVVTEAYAQLTSEGFLQARTGAGTRVVGDAVLSAAGEPVPAQPVPAGYRYDLLPGVPDLRAFPRRRWAEAVRVAATTMAHDDLWYPDVDGLPALRRALADYLVRCRGAAVTARDVIATAGISHGLTLALRALRRAGFTSVAVEDPGWQRPWRLARDCGLEVVPVPVDDGGIHVDPIEARDDLRAVLLTPAHQFPTGVALAPRRRAALLDRLRRVDGVLLEDDYDAEFRYDHRAVGAVQGTDPERVFLFGSVSKTLAPAIGLGWMVAPARWRGAVREAGFGDRGPSPLTQTAFTYFLDTGGFDRHLRDSRRRLRARREALVAALTRHLPRRPVSGAAAGLHLVLHLGEEYAGRVASVVSRLSRQGLRLSSLDNYRGEPDHTRPGLVLGYGNLATSVIDDAVALLAGALAAAAAVPRPGPARP